MRFPKRRIIQRLVKEHSPLLDTLNDEEKEIVRLTCAGVTEAQIARKFGITQSVLQHKKQDIHKKLNIHESSRHKIHNRDYQTAGEWALYNSWLDKFEK